MKKKRNGKSREILLVNSSVGCPYFVKISPINREKGIKNENQFISTQQRSSVLRPFVHLGLSGTQWVLDPDICGRGHGRCISQGTTNVYVQSGAPLSSFQDDLDRLRAHIQSFTESDAHISVFSAHFLQMACARYAYKIMSLLSFEVCATWILLLIMNRARQRRIGCFPESALLSTSVRETNRELWF